MTDTVAYSSPFIPPEWIAAHGLRPSRLGPSPDEPSIIPTAMGRCSYAAMLCTCAQQLPKGTGVIVATSCDQMRRASEVIAGKSHGDSFLFNVPATWQSDTSRRMYREELLRLGQWMQRRGGKAPTPALLAQTMVHFEQMRDELRQRRTAMRARDYAVAIAQFGATGELSPHATDNTNQDGIATAIVGGPLRYADLKLMDQIEDAGGCVVLDATETGERGMVIGFDHRRLSVDPLEELARAYFSTMPEPFRRPNSHLYDYLRSEISQRRVRGIVLTRRVWCDAWHAELVRLREVTGLPVVEVDLDTGTGDIERNRTRVESLLEILRGQA